LPLCLLLRPFLKICVSISEGDLKHEQCPQNTGRIPAQ
jgi:hypothetical protein